MHTNYDTITVTSVHATIVSCNVIKGIYIYIYRRRIIYPYFFSQQVGNYVAGTGTYEHAQCSFRQPDFSTGTEISSTIKFASVAKTGL